MQVLNTFFRPTVLLFAFSLILAGCQTKQQNNNSQEAIAPTEDEWTVLFDGSSTEGWRGYNQETLPGAWTIEDGCLMSSGAGGDLGGDIVYDQPFENFTLALEWKISPGGNSGIFYHVIEGEKYEAAYQTGPEYQLIDDIGFPQELADWQQTGADYAMHPADSAEKVLKPVGQWNSSKIVFDKGYVEHWLNGKRIVAFQAWDDVWNQKVAEGKWKDYPDYGRATEGLIGLQDHGSPIWFRNIRIKVR